MENISCVLRDELHILALKEKLIQMLFYIKQFDTETKQSAALKCKNPLSAEQKRQNQQLFKSF